eukprot:GEMP01044254.1.p1 GENE.GEMP01044254.1~~GEMP01044254.1.p1  ORF type:complete len:349 (+),score=89.85 GEMP01044254.1:80-1048(+)
MKYTLHYLEQRKSLAQKALIAAQFNGITIEQMKLTKVTDKDVQASPVKTLPFLQTDMGCIFASNSIARFIARARRDTGLTGDSFLDSAKVDSWTEFASREIEIPVCCCVLAVDGNANFPITQAAYDKALKDLQVALTKLEEHIKNQPFLVGHRPTLADIVVVCALLDGFRKVLDTQFRKPFPKVVEWFTRCAELPQFKQIIGADKLCEKTPQINLVTAAVAEKPVESKQQAVPKQQAQPKQQPQPKQQAAPPAAAAPPPSAPTTSANTSPEDLAALEAQKLKVRDLKVAKASADDITAAVAELKRLKELCGEVDPPKKGKKK